MLKFRDLNEKNIEKLTDELFSSDDYVKEALFSLDYSDPDVSYGVAESFGCILIRIFDCGRYLFLYPIDFTENADTASAILELSEYAMREEIGFTLTDVPREGVSELLGLGFLHLDIDAESADSYRVRVKTECELAKAIPEFYIGDLYASALTEEDRASYAEICRDETLNRFWGYNYKEDTAQATDEFFFDGARTAFSCGASMVTALHLEGELVGFTELFAFDGRGSCEFAVKVASEHQGRGYGSLATKAAIESARRLGVYRIYCDVMNENLRSFSLMKKHLEETESVHPDRKRFTLSII